MPFSDYFNQGVDNVSNAFQNRLQNVNDLVSNPVGYLSNKMGFDNTSTQAATTPAPIENRTIPGPVSPEPYTAPMTQPAAVQEPVAMPTMPTMAPVAMTTATMPPPAQVAAPQVVQQQPPVQVAPQVVQQQPPAQPAPQQSIFDRMIQAESGGRHTDRAGNILTSPRGAQGIAQIMPATAANPGFGVKPATPEELATPEGNRAFGERYFTGLTNYYKGDERRAAAAYNAGAGRVNKAIAMSQQSGGNFEQYLPQETQRYLAKISAPAPVVQPAPAPIIQQEGQPVLPVESQQVIGNAQHYADLNSNDPKKLAELIYRMDTPPAITKDALSRLHSDVSRQNMMERVNALGTEYMANNNVNGLMREMNKKGEEGSYFKAWLFMKMGMDSLAKQEMEKISPTLKTTPVQVDNQYYSATYDAEGNVRSARDVNGNAVDNKTLAKIAAMATSGKDLDTVGGTFVNDKTGEVGRVVTNKTTGQSYVQTDTGRKPLTGFRPQTSTGAFESHLGQEEQLSRMRGGVKLETLRSELGERIRSAGPEAANKAIAEHNFKYSDNVPYQTYTPGGPTLTTTRPATTAGQAMPAAAPAAISPQQAAAIQAVPQQAAPVPQPVPQRPAAAPTPQRPIESAVELPQPPVRGANESPAAFEGRFAAWKKEYEAVSKKQQSAMTGAQDIYDIARQINETLPKATGSVIGDKVDKLAGVFGYSTEGAKANAQLQVLGNRILMNVPRFEGPQSDKDTATYREAAGQLANPQVPVDTRIAAFKTITDINKKYAPNLNWDFSTKSDVRKKADEIIGR
jgi:hypothetical protein